MNAKDKNSSKGLSQSNYEESKDEAYKAISDILHKHDYDTTMMLATSVAAVCRVDVQDMLSTSHKVRYAYARWLFFYALHYAKQCSNAHVCEMLSAHGLSYQMENVRTGINRMGEMIDHDISWKNRWDVVKRIIKEIQGEEPAKLKKQKIVITVPKDVEVEIKKQ